MKKLLLHSLFIYVSLLVAVVGVVGAQEIQITGPLAGAPAVENMRIYRDGKFQVQPFVGFTLQDTYSHTAVFGAQAKYHFFDWLGVNLLGSYMGVSWDSKITDQVKKDGATVVAQNGLSLPSNEQFPKQIGQMTWMIAAEAVFIPFRGKVAAFQKFFVDTDLYVFAGLGVIGVEERANVSEADCVSDDFDKRECLIRSQTRRSARVAIAPSFGFGLNFYFSKLVGMALEWRGFPFAWNTSGTDERGGSPRGEFPDGKIDAKDRIMKMNHMVSLGVTFQLPPDSGE